jgi:hypothetical protein
LIVLVMLTCFGLRMYKEKICEADPVAMVGYIYYVKISTKQEERLQEICRCHKC